MHFFKQPLFRSPSTFRSAVVSVREQEHSTGLIHRPAFGTRPLPIRWRKCRGKPACRRDENLRYHTRLSLYPHWGVERLLNPRRDWTGPGCRRLHSASGYYAAFAFPYRKNLKKSSEYKLFIILVACQEAQVPKWKTRSIILLPLAWNGAAPRMPQLSSRHRRGPQGGESMCFSFAGLYVPVLELSKGRASPQVTETQKNRSEVPS